ncbi:MAG: hypothetical protein ACE5MG_12485 [Candidatus Methylomirabilales bacterium]
MRTPRRFEPWIILTTLGILFFSLRWAEAGWVGQRAPELTNQVWINSAPLRLADLRGKVILLEFWTYG